jgi:hypothetical protein
VSFAGAGWRPPCRSSFSVAILLAIGLLGGCASTPPPITATIVLAGAVEAAHTGSVAAPGTSLGVVRVVPADAMPNFLPGGTDINARLGTDMGIEVVIKGPKFGSVVPLSTRVTHPPFQNPATGKLATVERWDSPMNAGIPRFAGWVFDQPWELVPGTWTIEILEGEHPLVAQKFTVTIAAGKAAASQRDWANLPAARSSEFPGSTAVRPASGAA